MTREEAHKLVDELFNAGEEVTSLSVNEGDEPTPKEERKLPEGKRAVRTDSSGDRVYYLDEEKKTRHWVTNPDVLEKLGFKIDDVVKVEDKELLKYQMGPAIYRVEDESTKD